MKYDMIDFRVLTTYSEEAVRYRANLIRNEGIKIVDGRKTEIINNSDSSIIEEVAIICCTAAIKEYEAFRIKYKYDEIMYEGFKTLT